MMLTLRNNRFINKVVKNIFPSQSGKNILMVFSGDVIAKLLGVIIALMIIRNVTVEDYALFTTFEIISFWLAALFGNGINTAVIRFSAEIFSIQREQSTELFFFNFVFQILIYVFLLIFVFAFSKTILSVFFGGIQYKSSLYFGAIGGFVLLISNASLAILKAQEQFKHLVLRNWWKQLIYLAMLVLFYSLSELNFKTVAYSFLTAHTIISFVILINAFRHFHLKKALLNLFSTFRQLKHVFLSSIWLVFYFFTLTLMSRVDVFMINKYRSQVELAEYGVALKYYSLALMILLSINTVLLPKFSKIEMQNFKAQKMFLKKWFSYSVWIIVPIVLFAIFGKNIFLLMNGVQYEKSFLFFLIFLIGVFFSLTLSPLVNILMARNKTRFLFIAAAFAFIFNLVFSLTLVPIYGGYVAALINIGSHLIINGSSFFKIIFSKNSIVDEY